MRILVTGARGMLGGAIARRLVEVHGPQEVLRPTSGELDLRDAKAVRDYFRDNAVDTVVHAAAKVGGIQDRLDRPSSYLLDNLKIDTSVLSACIDARIQGALYIGSAAIYPALTDQPIRESALMTGLLEPALEPYALAKIAGSRFCEYASKEFGLDYRVAIPSNLYGPGEQIEPGRSHLAGAAILKCHAAMSSGDSSVEVWGDGTARRELTFVGDIATWLADHLGETQDWPSLLNVGSGTDHTVREIYEVAAQVTGFTGEFVFDASKPVGVKQRLLDSSTADALGWRATTSLEDGFAQSYAAMTPGSCGKENA